MNSVSYSFSKIIFIILIASTQYALLPPCPASSTSRNCICYENSMCCLIVIVKEALNSNSPLLNLFVVCMLMERIRSSMDSL